MVIWEAIKTSRRRITQVIHHPLQIGLLAADALGHVRAPRLTANAVLEDEPVAARVGALVAHDVFAVGGVEDVAAFARAGGARGDADGRDKGGLKGKGREGRYSCWAHGDLSFSVCLFLGK